MKSILRRWIVGTAACLLVLTGPVARADDTQTLCPHGLTKCVIGNWGVIEPDSAASAASNDRVADGRTAPISLTVGAVKSRPVATLGRAESGVKGVVSPVGLFAKNTDALIAALHAARFRPDGSVATGGDRVTAAASEIRRVAGDKYLLTLYVKVPQTLRPDDDAALAKKVASINALLADASPAPRS